MKARILASNKKKNERYNQSTGNVDPAPEVNNHLDESLPDTELPDPELGDDNLLGRGKRVKKPTRKLLEAEPLYRKKKQKIKTVNFIDESTDSLEMLLKSIKEKEESKNN